MFFFFQAKLLPDGFKRRIYEIMASRILSDFAEV